MQYITKKHIILPKRKKDSKKGDNGKVLAIGGSKDYVGAIALAGLAALRSGCDWVTVAAPEKVGWAINALSPDLVVKKYKGDDFCASRAKDILNFEKDFDAVLIGNGIGMHAKTFVKKYVKESKKLLVVDADGIKHSDASILKNSIITPHIKELEIFMDNSKIEKAIIEKIINEKNVEKRALLVKNAFDGSNIKYSNTEKSNKNDFNKNGVNNNNNIIIKNCKNTIENKIKNNKNIKNDGFFEKNNVILLKGPIDTIISKEKILFVKGGNPGMAKAGTGDVLAGLCVGFLAQSKNLLQSAINASYINKQIGDILLKKKKGFTYLASDIVWEIERVLGK